MACASPRVGSLVTRIERFCSLPHCDAGPALAADMAEVRRGVDLLELEFSRMAAAFATMDEFDQQGSVSPIHWIRHHCKMGGGAAADRLAVGEHLAELPQSAEALAAG